MSKNLEHFWRWALGEKPDAETFCDKATENLSEIEDHSVRDAAMYVTQQGLGRDFDTSLEDFRYCLVHHPEAFRDGSLDLYAAIERMHARVPKGERPEAITDEEFNARNDPGPEWWKSDTADAFAYAMQARAHEVTGISEAHAMGAGRASGKTDRLHDLRSMFTDQSPRVIIHPDHYARLARDFGIPDWNEPVRPMPAATPQADGTHMLDRMCQCGRFIIKSGGLHAHDHGTHQEHGCI